MNQSYLVSVLVPICNVQTYLRECLDSLEHQTLQNIEFICIDDGSTDLSGTILEEYVARDARFKVISKPNSGYGHSMNQGLARARGEYIGILESDDFADCQMFERLYSLAKEHDADIVKSNYFEHQSDRPAEQDCCVDNLWACPFDEVFCPVDNQSIFLTQPAIWSALYRREFLDQNEVRFLETPGASFQDTSFNFKAFATAQRVFLTREAFLHYRIDNSASSVKSMSKVFCICDEYQEIWRFLKQRPCLVEKLQKRVPQIQYGGYIWNLRRLSPELQYRFYEVFLSEFQQFEAEGLLDAGIFDPHAWAEIELMLNDPRRRFESEFGPVEVETSYLVWIRDGLKDATAAFLDKLAEQADGKTEVLCFIQNGQGDERPFVDRIMVQDKRFFDADSAYSNKLIGCIDSARMRGNRLIVFDCIEDSDETPQAIREEETHAVGDSGQLETQAQMPPQTQMKRLKVFAVEYDRDALLSLDLPLSMPLLATPFYFKAANGCILAGAPLQPVPQIGQMGGVALGPYENAVRDITQLARWNEAMMFDNGESNEAIKLSFDALGSLWKNVRKSRELLNYNDRMVASPIPSSAAFRSLDCLKGDFAQKPVDISVIVPVYNMESYLDECVASILSQKGCNFEVIFVDDGSTDSSYRMLQTIAQNDSRVSVITQLNGGVSSARNRGIEYAKGTYLAFIDPDDFYPNDTTLFALVSAATENRALLCGGSFSIVDNETGEIVETFFGDESPYTFHTEEFRTFREDQFDYGWIRFIFHNSLFKDANVRFPEVFWYEDPIFLMHVMEEVERYYTIPRVVYRYRVNHKKANWTVARTVDMLKGIQHNMQFALDNNYDRLYTILVKRLEWANCRAIIENCHDEEVFLNLLEIQANLDISHVSFVNEKKERYLLLKTWRDITSFVPDRLPSVDEKPSDNADALSQDAAEEVPGGGERCLDDADDVLQGTVEEAPREVAIVRLAHKAARSGFYGSIQKVLWRLQGK